MADLPDYLTTQQITFCLRQFADQLSQREGQPTS
jgi:hypothetical protein